MFKEWCGKLLYTNLLEWNISNIKAFIKLSHGAIIPHEIGFEQNWKLTIRLNGLHLNKVNQNYDVSDQLLFTDLKFKSWLSGVLELLKIFEFLPAAISGLLS